VTALSAPEIVRSHYIRDHFWPLIADDPRVDLGQDLPPLPVPNRKEVAYSVDLSRATDLCPFQLGRLIWDILLDESNNFPKWKALDREAIRKEVDGIFGPHLLSYPDGESFLSSRGWLMGNPLSWLTLTLFHLSVMHAVGIKKYWVRGDDLVFIGTQDHIDMYNDLVQGSGLLINRRKSFISKTSFVFAEKTYVLRGRSWCPLGDVSLSGVMDKSREIPQFFSEEFEAKRVDPVIASRVRKVLMRVYRDDLAKCKKYHLPIFLPKELGGMGFPHKGGLSGALRSHHEYVTRVFLHGESVRLITMPRFTAKVFRYFRDLGRKATAAKKSLHMLGTWVPVTDPMKAVSGDLLSGQMAYVINGGKTSDVAQPPIRDMGLRFQRFRKKLLRLRRRDSFNLIRLGEWDFARIRFYLSAADASGWYVLPNQVDGTAYLRARLVS